MTRLRPASVAAWLTLAALGVRDTWSLLALSLSAFVALAIAFDTARAVAARRVIAGEGVLTALASLLRRNQRRYGGFVVHLGVVLVVLGITGSMNWSQEKNATLAPGESVRLRSRLTPIDDEQVHIAPDGVAFPRMGAEEDHSHERKLRAETADALPEDPEQLPPIEGGVEDPHRTR